MQITRTLGLGAIVLGLGMAGPIGRVPAAEGETPRAPVRIGMVNSLFRGQNPTLMLAMMGPFGSLMQSQTGVRGELTLGGDYAQLAQQLAEDRIQLGIFHGIEFAWAKQKYPGLQPLMIAVNQNAHLHAHLVVRDENEAEDISDLKGQILAEPKGTREHCRLFLQHLCQEAGVEARSHFDKLTTPLNIEDALDDVVDDEIQAIVVDGVALECYQRRKPGRFAKLKIVTTSDTFPAGVVVYHPGTLDEETLDRFREGMMNANKNPLGKQLLTLWKLTSFEPIPEDYEAILADIVTTYPAAAPPTSPARKAAQ